MASKAPKSKKAPEPQKPKYDQSKILKLWQDGKSIREIACVPVCNLISNRQAAAQQEVLLPQRSGLVSMRVVEEQLAQGQSLWFAADVRQRKFRERPCEEHVVPFRLARNPADGKRSSEWRPRPYRSRGSSTSPPTG